MAFLNNIFLWSALAAAGVAVPIIIHLLNRYRHRQVDWAAMELLRRALTIRSRQVRLEDILMLVLRCVAILLIALALARPTIIGSAGSWLGGQQQVGVVVAIDASFSMQHTQVTSRFDKARERAREIFRTLRPGDPVTLVLLGEQRRILLRNVGYDAELFARALNDAAPMAEKLNLDEALDDLKNLVAELKAPARECYIITDAQASTWENATQSTRQSLAEIGGEARVYVLPASTSNAENAAIVRFELVRGAMRKGTLARYMAEVKNFGRVPLEAVSVSLSVNGQPADQRIIARLEPGQSQAVPLMFRCEQGGNFQLRADIGPDALMADNSAHAIAHVREAIRILCVDGEPSAEPYKSETDYLQLALVPRRTAAAQSILLERVPPSELPLRRLSEFDIVMLANVGELGTQQAKPLRSFVEMGGGLVVFLGKRVDAFDYGRKMVADGVHLLPGELLDVVRPAQDVAGFGVEAAPGGHVLAGIVGALPEELVRQATIGRFFNLKLHEGSRAILNIAGSDMPLLAEKRLGRGRVLLWTTTADREWNEMVIHPLYPILMNEMVTYLTEQAYERPLVVGQAMAIPLAAEVAQDTAGIILPDGTETSVGVERHEGQATVRFAGTAQPGFYTILPGKDAPSVFAAVNVDPGESDVVSMETEMLARLLGGLPLRVMGEQEGLAETIRTTRQGREFWRVLLIAGLSLLLLESLLAHHFSRRMAAAAGAAPRSAHDLLKAA
jgi:hypothetical protein